MRWRWVTVPLPIVIGGTLAVLFLGDFLPNPIVYARVDLGILSFLAGMALALAVLTLLLFLEWSDRRQEHVGAVIQSYTAMERLRFIQRLDHELKNPLTAIRAALANLADTPLDQAQCDSLGSARTQALRLSQLMSNLRKLAELETRPLDRTSIDLGEVLHEALALAEENPANDGRQLTLTLPKAPWPLPIVSGDRDLLLLAIHNLLDNAIKFTRPGDTVEVRAFEDDATVVLEVADTGPGIAESDVTNVWEELYRGSAARGVPGSGLGLALVRAIAERHDGQVSLRSRLGQGTVFTLRLPI
jgi:two-component system, OmpR family, sensor kinase